MNATHVATLRAQLGSSQQELADLVNEADPSLRLDRNAVSRYERGVRTPDYRIASAMARVWLHHGYPVSVTLPDGSRRDGTLTTDHAASAWGQPVVVIDGQAYGTDDLAAIDLDEAPELMRATFVVAR